MMRAAGSLLAVLALLLGRVPKQAAAEPKAAILLPGSIGDHSWNALGVSILQSLKADGFGTAYSENIADELRSGEVARWETAFNIWKIGQENAACHFAI